ncbi:MAG: tRNA methyltransferase [Alphaproteobacteria bacterium TMED87]|nr:tRNA methyltransferase [Rhodospirillaceae bacterium]OUV08019.1 MAG: tRNA methyltransferase [Alphaproteobacteria bacterium TMED87]
MNLVLFQPEIPQNTGAIIRLCSCLSVPMEIIEPCGFIMGDKRIKRVAMDYKMKNEIIRHKSWEAFYEKKRQSNKRLILFTTKVKKSFRDFNFINEDLLLFGNESSGVPERVRDKVDESVTIPIAKDARSLNISMSVAIGVSEAMRQIEAK